MHTARPLKRRARLFIGAALLVLFALPALAQKARIKADDYQIDAEIIPKTHHLTAKAKVKFTALEDVNFASFELHDALHPTHVTDEGKPLTAERVDQDDACPRRPSLLPFPKAPPLPDL